MSVDTLHKEFLNYKNDYDTFFQLFKKNYYKIYSEDLFLTKEELENKSIRYDKATEFARAVGKSFCWQNYRLVPANEDMAIFNRIWGDAQFKSICLEYKQSTAENKQYVGCINIESLQDSMNNNMLYVCASADGKKVVFINKRLVKELIVRGTLEFSDSGFVLGRDLFEVASSNTLYLNDNEEGYYCKYFERGEEE